MGHSLIDGEWVRERDEVDELLDRLNRRDEAWQKYRHSIIESLRNDKPCKSYHGDHEWWPRSDVCEYLDNLVGVAIEHEYEGDDDRFFAAYFAGVDMPEAYKKAAHKAVELLLEKQREKFMENF